MGIFSKYFKPDDENNDYVAKLIAENPLPEIELTEEEDQFWASFVHEFVNSEEWYLTVKRLIGYWRGIDVDSYPMYEPLQALSDWELAYGTEVWIVYDFISNYVQYGEIDDINPEVSAETRKFISEFFAAKARQMNESDIKGFVDVLKSQIDQFGIDGLKKDSSIEKFM